MSAVVQKPTTDPSPLADFLADADKLRDYPIDTLERLFAMKEREDAKFSKLEFDSAMLAVSKEAGIIRPNARNQHGGLYARIDAVDKELSPLIERHGLSLSFSQGDGGPEGQIRHVMVVRHVGGHSERFWMDLPPDGVGNRGMNPLQGVASSNSYAQRYLKLDVFNLQVGEDKDGEEQAVITESQANEILAILEELSIDQSRFLAMFQVESVERIPLRRHSEALLRLNQKRKQLAKAEEEGWGAEPQE